MGESAVSLLTYMNIASLDQYTPSCEDAESDLASERVGDFYRCHPRTPLHDLASVLEQGVRGSPGVPDLPHNDDMYDSQTNRDI